MSKENPTWGAPRIHGELLMLGIDVSESTVGRYVLELTPKASDNAALSPGQLFRNARISTPFITIRSA